MTRHLAAAGWNRCANGLAIMHADKSTSSLQSEMKFGNTEKFSKLHRYLLIRAAPFGLST
jgi:hypothetical protein